MGSDPFGPDLNGEAQQDKGIAFTVTVQIEAAVDAPFQHMVDDKVECGQQRQVIAAHGLGSAMSIGLHHHLGTELLSQRRKGMGVIRHQAYIEPVAFVAGPGVGDTVQRDTEQGVGLACAHVLTCGVGKKEKPMLKRPGSIR